MNLLNFRAKNGGKIVSKYSQIQQCISLRKFPKKDEDFLSSSFRLTNGNFVILFPAIFLSVFDGLTVFYLIL